jgi:two-component sensor histidine kinase
VYPVEVTSSYFSFLDEEFSLAFAQDITARKKAELALRQSEERLRQVALVCDIGVFERDLLTDESYWSPELREYWRLTPDEPIPATVFPSSIHPDDRPLFDETIQRSRDPRGDGRYGAQLRIIHPRDGTIRWLDIRAQVFFEGEGSARRAVRVVGANIDVTSKVLADVALKESLAEKETLLREVHHRVKNNLQIISSLLHFQAKKVKAPEDLAAFVDGRDRLRAMILVHEKLYRSTDLSRVDFGGYLQALVRDLRHSNSSGVDVDVRVRTDVVALPIESALPCGMILCELLTNVFIYAFPHTRTGNAEVDLAAVKDLVRLSVRDDGVGLPAGFDPFKATSFGWQLIRNLAAQIGGSVSVDRSDGTLVTVTFACSRGAELNS